MTPAAAGSGTMTAVAAASGTEVAAASGSGTMAARSAVNGDGLYCSETLACSDVDVICTDADGIRSAASATGSMVPA